MTSWCGECFWKNKAAKERKFLKTFYWVCEKHKKIICTSERNDPVIDRIFFYFLKKISGYRS